MPYASAFWFTLLILVASPLSLCAEEKLPFPIDSINCDSEVVVSVIGDSIVEGAGDTENGGKGGYVKRLDQTFRGVTFANYGKYGYTTAEILAFTRSILRSDRKAGRILRSSDLVIIDAGRNDWKTHKDPLRTVRTLQALVRVLRRFTTAEVLVSTNLPTNKESQSSFVKSINRAMRQATGNDFQVAIRFDKIPSSVLSADDIHPSSSGFEVITEFLVKFFTNRFLPYVAHRTLDSDLNGVTDWCEAYTP